MTLAAWSSTVRDGSYGELYAGRETPLWGTAPGRLVARISEWASAGEVLDVGCGDGKNSLFLEEQGFSVTGIDISAEAIQLLYARFAAAGRTPGGHYETSDVRSWRPDGMYDVLVSYGLYHALPRSDRAARHRAIQSYVRPGGLLIFCSLLNSIPIPSFHRTPSIDLPGIGEIVALFDRYDLLEISMDEIIESHPPHVPTHKHQGIWMVARARA